MNPDHKTRALFIVLEGIDGSGTTTQAHLIREYLATKSRKAVVTSEPSNGPIGNLIREGLRGRTVFTTDQRLFDAQMAYLFAADRHDHLYNELDGVTKRLKEGYDVISTRYYFSSLAYHCETDDDFAQVMILNKNFPNPDLVIYIDNPVAISLARVGNRTSPDRYENEEKLTKARANYERVFSTYEDLLLEVDGRLPPHQAAHLIAAFLERELLDET